MPGAILEQTPTDEADSRMVVGVALCPRGRIRGVRMYAFWEMSRECRDLAAFRLALHKTSRTVRPGQPGQDWNPGGKSQRPRVWRRQARYGLSRL